MGGHPPLEVEINFGLVLPVLAWTITPLLNSNLKLELEEMDSPQGGTVRFRSKPCSNRGFALRASLLELELARVSGFDDGDDD